MSHDGLFAPFRFRSGATARNRMTLAPLTNQQSAEDGSLLEEELRWLQRRAAGGYSIIETCASHVSATGKGFAGQLGVQSDTLLPGLRRLATSIAGQGALGLVQLYHGGARSPSKLTGVQSVSASTWYEDVPGFEAPRAAGEADIQGFIEDFVAAAHRAKAAGFQGVELHAAHGYLLSQFLSSTRNPRTDGWGGTLEGRARLVRTIARRIRRELSGRFIVGVRLSPEGMGNARGIDIDDMVQVAKWLSEDGADCIHVSLWNHTRNTLKYPEVHPLTLFRRALPPEVALIAAGSVWTREDAEVCQRLGADFVALGRAAIVDPDWPLHVARPDFVPVRAPRTSTQLHEVAVSERFVNYLRNNFRGMVAEES